MAVALPVPGLLGDSCFVKEHRPQASNPFGHHDNVMDDQELKELEARRRVRYLWDEVVHLRRVAENRRRILDLTRTLSDYDPAVEKAELEQAERQQACAWIQYLDLNRKVYIST
jgi:hypothetical protein